MPSQPTPRPPHHALHPASRPKARTAQASPRPSLSRAQPENHLRLAAEGPRVAILVPCLNEGATIARVVRDFIAALPDAQVYVYDNGSTDDTVAEARAAGAIVRIEPARGKGNVVRRMFADVEADAYVLVDGDATYEVGAVHRMLDTLFDEKLDMVTGVRIESSSAAYRSGHRLGNRVLTGLVSFIFDAELRDMLSGYRVFSRRFVKSFPARAQGFEVETELTVHALELRVPAGEVETAYGERPENSTSKLRTFRDGFRVLMTILDLVKNERPLLAFSMLSAVAMLGCLFPSAGVLRQLMTSGARPDLHLVVLATAFLLLATIGMCAGLVLDAVARGRRESLRMHYMAVRPHRD